LIWLTWRQFRVQAASAAAFVFGFAVLLALTGPHLASLFASSPIASCHGGPDACGAYANNFFDLLVQDDIEVIGGYDMLYMLGLVVILAAPAVIGIFWGAPLVAAEFEAGTHYLAWTQTITRTRWLVVKLALIGMAAMAVTEALSLMQAWWATPIRLAVDRGACCSDLAMNQFSPLVFAARGITPLGYAAFAFALGVTVGVLVRRTVLAMALTLAIFAALQVAMPLWIRPHLFPPVHAITTLGSWASINVEISQDATFVLTPDGFSDPEASILSTKGPVNAAGERVSTLPAACRPGAPAANGKDDHIAMLQCLDSHGVRIAVTYQPASRYWTFQWVETAMYLALALALAGFCFWRIVRRLS
jgi:hypothetical protein